MVGNNIDEKIFFDMIENMFDEVIIWDANYTIAYINKASWRHYGCAPEQMIGRSFFELINNAWWEPSILPIVYKEKMPFSIRQTTHLGTELITIAKPIFNEDRKLIYVIMNVRETIGEHDLYVPNQSCTLPSIDSDDDGPLVCESPAMRQVFTLLSKIAYTGVPCIFSGELGVGKKTAARYLFSISNHKNKAFVQVQCGGYLEKHLERELFGDGIEQGAFTKASNGVLLLDNISEMPLWLQSKLFKHLTDNAEESQTRLLCTTSKDLGSLVKSGLFREDLFYFLNVINIHILPLRNRKEDIRPLIHYFLGHSCVRHGVSRHFSEGALQAMESFEWRGNALELRNIIEQLVVTVDEICIRSEHLPKRLFGIRDTFVENNEKSDGSSDNLSFRQRMDKYESVLVNDAYAKLRSSRKVAEYFQISQTKANKLIQKHVTKKLYQREF